MKRVKVIAMIAVLSIGLIGCSNVGAVDDSSGNSKPNTQSSQNSMSGDTANNAASISVEKAKEIALNHAGLTADQVTFIKAEKDFDNGIEVYDIEFHSNAKEYDYEINAASGDIISYDYDIEGYTHQSNSTTSNTANSTTISAERAKEIALNHAGLASNQVTFDKVEKDYDDGISKYDIEFYYNNREYSYKIDANTGNILSYEQD